MFFYKTYARTLYAVDVSSGEVDSLVSISGARPAGDHHMSSGAAGTHIYAALRTPNRDGAIFAIPLDGGEPEIVEDRLDSPCFAVSADEARFAVNYGCNGCMSPFLAVFDRTTKQSIRIVAGYWWYSLSLSPDGRLLVYDMPDTVPLHIYDVTTQTELAPRFFSPGRHVDLTIGNIQWVGSQPRVMVAERYARSAEIQLSVINLVSGRRESYGSVAAGNPSAGGAYRLAWSNDGSVAVWTPVAIGPQTCSVDGLCISRHDIHWRLYLLREPHGTPEVLAEMVASEGAGWLEFSPDGSLLGYTLFGRLHVVDTT